jgi:hypothetical protein
MTYKWRWRTYLYQRRTHDDLREALGRALRTGDTWLADTIKHELKKLEQADPLLRTSNR